MSSKFGTFVALTVVGSTLHSTRRTKKLSVPPTQLDLTESQTCNSLPMAKSSTRSRLTHSGLTSHPYFWTKMTDSDSNIDRIYTFDPLNLTHPAPLRTFVPPLPTLSAASFYVRCAVSPDSRYLASGSADGSVYLWDTEGNGTDAVRVRGHEREVSGLDWTHNGVSFFHAFSAMLAS